MPNDDPRNIDRAWELMKKIGFAKLVTRDGDKLRARPMSANIEREENAIYLLTRRSASQGRRDRKQSLHQPVFCGRLLPEVRLADGDRCCFQRPRQDQGAVFNAGEGVVGKRRRSQYPRAQDHPR